MGVSTLAGQDPEQLLQLLRVAKAGSGPGLGQLLEAQGSSPSQRVARREQAVVLADMLGRLPEDYREVVILRHLEGLSFPQVARRMGRTLDSVKKLWARALAQLRDSLGDSS